MATTTPNFGWSVPTSTDLVKDGATAIETLGDSIDASLVDLKGGTTGQLLSKNSNTDLDYTWVDPSTGDITGVTAGTGISGGGASGTVTITNSMATAIDAKGDLIAGTAADTFSRLAVGTNAYVLTADSAEATGMKWAAIPASTPTLAGCLLTHSGGSVAVSGSTSADQAWNNEIFDTNGYHDTVTNNTRITIPSGKAGYYLVTQKIELVTTTEGRWTHILRKNGADYQLSEYRYSGNSTNNGDNWTTSTVLNLAVGDYLESRVSNQTSNTLYWYGDSSGAKFSQFSAIFLGV